MPHEHRSGGDDALSRQTERLRWVLTSKRQLQELAESNNEEQLAGVGNMRLPGSCKLYDV